MTKRVREFCYSFDQSSNGEERLFVISWRSPFPLPHLKQWGACRVGKYKICSESFWSQKYSKFANLVRSVLHFWREQPYSTLPYISLLIKVLVHCWVRLFFAEGFSKVFKSLLFSYFCMIRDMFNIYNEYYCYRPSINKLRKYIIIIVVIITCITVMYFSERDRKMLFPDYYFFAKRRLVNHMIEEKRDKNLDDCELLCYLNDDCVSLNFKKDPEKIIEQYFAILLRHTALWISTVNIDFAKSKKHFQRWLSASENKCALSNLSDYIAGL